MPNRLGCSQHLAFVQWKCAGPRLCELVDASRIYYDRRLDDISEALVEIPLSGDVEAACCACLGTIEPWCHILTIVREGEGVVWTGPIQEVDYGFNDVIIRAKDKLAWLTVRVNEEDIIFNPNTTVPLTDIAEVIIEFAMADDGDSPCFLDSDGTTNHGILNLGDGFPPGTDRSREFPAFGGPTAYDDLSTLAEQGIDFTVIRQVLILGPEALPITPIATLTDEMLLGDVRVRKDGTSYANRFFVRFDGDDVGCPPTQAACPADAEVADKQCYGLIERVVDTQGLPSEEAAQVTANTYAETIGPLVPRFIDFPAGTQLSPEVPWVVNDMIPGQRVNVALNKYCFEVFQSFRLQKVTVDDTPEGEKISIDLGIFNTLGEL